MGIIRIISKAQSKIHALAVAQKIHSEGEIEEYGGKAGTLIPHSAFRVPHSKFRI